MLLVPGPMLGLRELLGADAFWLVLGLGSGLERRSSQLLLLQAARNPCTLAGIWPEGKFSGVMSVDP